MNFRLLLFLPLLLVMCLNMQAYTLEQLDSCLQNRPQYQREKEMRIALLRRQLLQIELRASQQGNANMSDLEIERMALYNEFYAEYNTYQFDSAMVYTQKQFDKAQQLHNVYYLDFARIHMVQLLATGGFYSQAETLVQQIDVSRLDRMQRFEFYMACFWLFNFWAAYTDGSEFSHTYNSRKLENARLALANAPAHSADRYYLSGEIAYIEGLPPQKAMTSYLRVVRSVPMNTRLYASAAYGLARAYRMLGQMQQYQNWLIAAAMSDQMCPLKENLALQELAMVLYKSDGNQLERASRYINYSMEDARFYHNKLRMLEISQKLPDIVSAYQQRIDNQRRHLVIILGLMSVITLLFLGSLVVVYGQNRKLHTRRRLIEKNNRDLSEMNCQITEVNSRLERVNTELQNTARIRENYLHLFVDLSALAMERIANYKNLVLRKIKAGQINDLLKTLNSDRISEQELNNFLQRFDKAFLELYPHFIDELNALLRPDAQLSKTADGSLTTELRILALIRLGVTESAEIATLLSYSPQTIYNYRTTSKNKALRRERFDEDIRALCKTL